MLGFSFFRHGQEWAVRKLHRLAHAAHDNGCSETERDLLQHLYQSSDCVCDLHRADAGIFHHAVKARRHTVVGALFFAALEQKDRLPDEAVLTVSKILDGISPQDRELINRVVSGYHALRDICREDSAYLSAHARFTAFATDQEDYFFDLGRLVLRSTYFPPAADAHHPEPRTVECLQGVGVAAYA